MDILSVSINSINLDDVNLIKMIIKLLFMSDISLGLINLNNVNHY